MNIVQSSKDRYYLIIGDEKFMFMMSNNHLNYSGSFPKSIVRIIRQFYEKKKGQLQLIKKYVWCVSNNLDWKEEFRYSNFILSNGLKGGLISKNI